jgi:hypothetical protein
LNITSLIVLVPHMVDKVVVIKDSVATMENVITVFKKLKI